MLKEDLARLRAHRTNRRLSEEEDRFERLAASACPFILVVGMPTKVADNHA